MMGEVQYHNSFDIVCGMLRKLKYLSTMAMEASKVRGEKADIHFGLENARNQ